MSEMVQGQTITGFRCVRGRRESAETADRSEGPGDRNYTPRPTGVRSDNNGTGPEASVTYGPPYRTDVICKAVGLSGSLAGRRPPRTETESVFTDRGQRIETTREKTTDAFCSNVGRTTGPLPERRTPSVVETVPRQLDSSEEPSRDPLAGPLNLSKETPVT